MSDKKRVHRVEVAIEVSAYVILVAVVALFVLGALAVGRQAF